MNYSIIGLIVNIILGFIFLIGIKFLEQKGNNLATLQDIKKITEKAEQIRTRYINQSYAWKRFFDYEFVNLKRIWGASWDLQLSARSLMPMVDMIPPDEELRKSALVERYKKHIEKVEMFNESVDKNKPFIPPAFYESCTNIRGLTIQLQNDFLYHFSRQREPDWKMIWRVNKELDEKIEDLNISIRNYINNKIYSNEV